MYVYIFTLRFTYFSNYTISLLLLVIPECLYIYKSSGGRHLYMRHSPQNHGERLNELIHFFILSRYYELIIFISWFCSFNLNFILYILVLWLQFFKKCNFDKPNWFYIEFTYIK